MKCTPGASCGATDCLFRLVGNYSLVSEEVISENEWKKLLAEDTTF